MTVRGSVKYAPVLCDREETDSRLTALRKLKGALDHIKELRCYVRSTQLGEIQAQAVVKVLPFAGFLVMCLCVPEDPDTHETRGVMVSTERSRKLYLPWVLGFFLARVLFSPDAVRSYQIIQHRSTDRRRTFEGIFVLTPARWRCALRSDEAESFSLVEITNACRFPTASLVYRHMTRLQVETIM